MKQTCIDEKVIKAYFRNEINNDLLDDARTIFNKLENKKLLLNSQGLAGENIVESIMQEGLDKAIYSDIKSYGIWRSYVLKKIR